MRSPFAVVFLIWTTGLLLEGQEGGDEGAAGAARKSASVVAAQDAVIYSEDVSFGGTRANGKGETLIVGSLQAGLYRRSLLAFNVDSVVPPGSVIVDAKLSLSVVASGGFPFVSIFPLQAPWAAGTTNPADELTGGEAQTGDVTWIFRLFHKTEMSRRIAWQQPGGDFRPDRPLVAAGGEVNGNRLTYTSPELVADVQAMLNRPDQHYGWLLAGEESAFAINFTQFASMEHAEATLRPRLEITYTEASDVDKVVANYDRLVTVAGTGEEGGRDNHWRARYEGGPALAAEMSRPSTAVAAADGTIYFTDTYAHAVRKITPTGRVHTVAGTGVEGYNLDEGPAREVQLDQPNGLAVMPNGNLYILDIDNKRVRKVTPDGHLTTVFHDETDPPFLTGRGLWVSPDEETIVYGSRTAVKQWSADDGAILVLADGFSRVANLGRDRRTGDFLVADVDDDTVWRVDPVRRTRTHIAGGGNLTRSGIDAKEAKLDGVRGLAVSSHGGYFLTAENGGSVWYVDVQGRAHILLPGSASGNVREGENALLRDLRGSKENVVSQPFSITIAPDGHLILVTNETGFIRAIPKALPPVIQTAGLTADGTFRLTWRAEPQRLYVVEGSADMQTWQPIREVAANRTSASLTQTILPENPQRFYRVRFFAP